MKKSRCIYFDLDSVLYLPDNFLEQALVLSIRAMCKLGLKASEQEALALLLAIRKEDSNAPDHFDRLVQRVNGAYDPLVVAAGVETFWDCKKDAMRPAENAAHVLEVLAVNHSLTIISNGIPVKQAGKLVRIGLARFFVPLDTENGTCRRRFFASTKPGERKPAAFLWDQARYESGIAHEDSMMVGDRYWNDILGANRLGMTTVKINQGGHAMETRREALSRHKESELARNAPDRLLLELMRPDFTIDNLAELPSIVSRLAG